MNTFSMKLTSMEVILALEPEMLTYIHLAPLITARMSDINILLTHHTAMQCYSCLINRVALSLLSPEGIISCEQILAHCQCVVMDLCAISEVL